jgi:hypothetical protein
MFIKLITAAHISIMPASVDGAPKPRLEPVLAPYLSPIVGPSINAVTLAPVVNCDQLPITKQTPFDILTACATGRVGWLKL